MTMVQRLIVAFAFFACISSAWAAKDDVAMSGLITHKEPLTRAKVMAMPKQTLNVTYITGRGEQKAVFTGGSLWDVLQAAQVVDQGKNLSCGAPSRSKRRMAMRLLLASLNSILTMATPA